jgi:hypothetical protein
VVLGTKYGRGWTFVTKWLMVGGNLKLQATYKVACVINPCYIVT